MNESNWFTTAVKDMRLGDRFMTNRSGMVTAVSVPYPDPASVPFAGTWCIDVRKDSDGSVFGLVGLQRYRVTRESVAASTDSNPDSIGAGWPEEGQS